MAPFAEVPEVRLSFVAGGVAYPSSRSRRLPVVATASRATASGGEFLPKWEAPRGRRPRGDRDVRGGRRQARRRGLRQGARRRDREGHEDGAVPGAVDGLRRAPRSTPRPRCAPRPRRRAEARRSLSAACCGSRRARSRRCIASRCARGTARSRPLSRSCSRRSSRDDLRPAAAGVVTNARAQVRAVRARRTTTQPPAPVFTLSPFRPRGKCKSRRVGSKRFILTVNARRDAAAPSYRFPRLSQTAPAPISLRSSARSQKPYGESAESGNGTHSMQHWTSQSSNGPWKASIRLAPE